jgi:ABC-type spermidine/putrescine transport system permease subunit I
MNKSYLLSEYKKNQRSLWMGIVTVVVCVVFAVLAWTVLMPERFETNLWHTVVLVPVEVFLVLNLKKMVKHQKEMKGLIVNWQN